MIEITITPKRKCEGTIDMYPNKHKVYLSFEQRGKKVNVEFTKKQWFEFQKIVGEYEYKVEHYGQC